jgi:hypothetical protein
MAPWPFGRDRTVLSYRRQGGSPPPDHETLTVHHDGTFDLWRTVGGTSPIGRFRGQVPDGDWTSLGRALDASRRAQPVHLSLPPDAAREKVIVGKATSTWADDAEPPPPFADLASVARRLARELTAFPQAAVALRLAGSASLVHLGSDEIELDLSEALVRAVRWEGGLVADTWEEPLRGPRSVTAGAGWTYEIPFGHPFGTGTGTGARVSAAVDNLLAFDGEFWRSCSLQAPAA